MKGKGVNQSVRSYDDENVCENGEYSLKCLILASTFANQEFLDFELKSLS